MPAAGSAHHARRPCPRSADVRSRPVASIRLALIALLAAAALAPPPGVAFGRREAAAPEPITPQPATPGAPGATTGAADLDAGLTERMQDLGFQLPSRAVRAVDFDLADVSGTVHSLQSYRGSVVFLNFWATWCGPCRIEMPDLQTLYEALNDNDRFTMLAVNLQEDAAQVRQFANEMGVSFRILLDRSGQASAAYGARTLPMSYLIDKDGVILARIIGIRDWAEPEFEQLFRALANRKSSAP